MKQLSKLTPEFLSNIENIIFDLGGVIVGLDESLTKDAFREIIGLDQIAGTKYTEFFHKIETGSIPEEEFRAALKEAAKDHGLSMPDDSSLDLAWNKMILTIPHKNIELLKILSQRFNIFLLSNTNSIHLRYFSENAFLDGCDFEAFEKLFINTYYSHLIGARKPDREAYDYVINGNSLEPSKTLFIDDNAPNFKGALEAGIYCYQIKGDLDSIGLEC